LSVADARVKLVKGQVAAVDAVIAAVPNRNGADRNDADRNGADAEGDHRG
jgi:hypothetical protein